MDAEKGFRTKLHESGDLSGNITEFVVAEYIMINYLKLNEMAFVKIMRFSYIKDYVGLNSNWLYINLNKVVNTLKQVLNIILHLLENMRVLIACICVKKYVPSSVWHSPP